MSDIRCFPRNHPLHHIIYDDAQREYYDTRLDIFLSEQHIHEYMLRPYDRITCPLPTNRPLNYFSLSLSEVEWELGNVYGTIGDTLDDATLSTSFDQVSLTYDTPEDANEAYEALESFIEQLRRRKPR